jgi:hypothetical protein
MKDQSPQKQRLFGNAVVKSKRRDQVQHLERDQVPHNTKQRLNTSPVSGEASLDGNKYNFKPIVLEHCLVSLTHKTETYL